MLCEGETLILPSFYSNSAGEKLLLARGCFVKTFSEQRKGSLCYWKHWILLLQLSYVSDQTQLWRDSHPSRKPRSYTIFPRMVLRVSCSSLEFPPAVILHAAISSTVREGDGGASRPPCMTNELYQLPPPCPVSIPRHDEFHFLDRAWNTHTHTLPDLGEPINLEMKGCWREVWSLWDLNLFSWEKICRSVWGLNLIWVQWFVLKR